LTNHGDDLYTVEATSLQEHPSTDFIVTLHPNDMGKDKLNVHDKWPWRDRYVVIGKPGDDPPREILAQVIKTEKMTTRHVGVDQTLREALHLRELGQKDDIKICVLKARKKKYGFKEWLLNRLGYQKGVVEVHENSPYMEHQIPVACLCEERVALVDQHNGTALTPAIGCFIGINVASCRCSCACILIIQRMVRSKMDSNRKYRKEYTDRYHKSSHSCT
jgi:hypothetical protein